MLDERRVSRLGEPERVRELDLRVMAISRRDLAIEVRAQRYREDLRRRIAHASVRLPALRERDTDMFVLAERLLGGLCQPHELPITLADEAVHEAVDRL